jgi:hypothetical protein
MCHAIVHEGDADDGLAYSGSACRCSTGLGVLVHVFVQRLHVLKSLVFTHQLHHGGQHGVRRAGGIGVCNLDFVLEGRFGQVSPALGCRNAFFLQRRLVVAETQGAGIDADSAKARLLGLAHSPVVQLTQL